MERIGEEELKTSSLLFDEAPLLVRPEMAKRIGLNEAIVVQQIHYWIESKRKNTKKKDLKNERCYRDGRFWTYNTYVEWQEQFPFWSVRTIERIFTGLEKKGILLSGCFNAWETDRTKWYTIDYAALDNHNKPTKKKPKDKEETIANLDLFHSDKLAECTVEHSDNLAGPFRQVDVTIPTTCGQESDKLSSAIPKITSKSSILDFPSKNIYLSKQDDIQNIDAPSSFKTIMTNTIDRLMEFNISVKDIEKHYKAVKATYTEDEYAYVLEALLKKMKDKPAEFGAVMKNWLDRNRTEIKKDDKSHLIKKDPIPEWLYKEQEYVGEKTNYDQLSNEEKRSLIEESRKRILSQKTKNPF